MAHTPMICVLMPPRRINGCCGCKHQHSPHWQTEARGCCLTQAANAQRSSGRRSYSDTPRTSEHQIKLPAAQIAVHMLCLLFFFDAHIDRCSRKSLTQRLYDIHVWRVSFCILQLRPLPVPTVLACVAFEAPQRLILILLGLLHPAHSVFTACACTRSVGRR
jgi:hypothetical protein